MPDEENDFLARARIPPRGAAEDYQVLQDMSEGPPHQIRGGPDVVAVICISCLERALRYQLGRD